MSVCPEQVVLKTISFFYQHNQCMPWGLSPVIVISAEFNKNKAEEKQAMNETKTMALIVNSNIIVLFLILFIC